MWIQQVVSVCSKLRVKIFKGSAIPPISNVLESHDDSLAWFGLTQKKRSRGENKKPPLAIPPHRGERGGGTTFLNDIETNSIHHRVIDLLQAHPYFRDIGALYLGKCPTKSGYFASRADSNSNTHRWQQK